MGATVGEVSELSALGRVIEPQLKVVDFVPHDGNWNWLELANYFPRDILERISACCTPNESLGEDSCLWKPSKNGKFSVKSAYGSVTGDAGLLKDNRWQIVWDNALPPRIKRFIWLARRRRLLTNCERVRRRLVDSEQYEQCGAVQESLIHVLRDYPLAVAVWMLQGNISVHHRFSEMDFDDWLLTNLEGQNWMGSSGQKLPSNLGSCVGCCGSKEIHSFFKIRLVIHWTFPDLLIVWLHIFGMLLLGRFLKSLLLKECLDGSLLLMDGSS